MWLYYYYFAFVSFLLLLFMIFESRLYAFMGIEKNVFYDGEYSDLLTGKAQGVRFIIMGIFFASYTFPAIVFYKSVDPNLFPVLCLTVWPFSFVLCYWGCVMLLRPKVYGEESRCSIPCDDYAKDALLSKSIPLSYTELVNKCMYSFMGGSTITLGLLINDPWHCNVFVRVLLWILYFVVLFGFTFMDKVNEYLMNNEKFNEDIRVENNYDESWVFDIRCPPGYFDYCLCAYFVPFIPTVVTLYVTGFLLNNGASGIFITLFV